MKTRVIYVIVALFTLASCGGGKQEPERPLGTECTFKSISFKPSENSHLAGTANAVKANGCYFVTFPKGIDLTSLKPSFADLSEGARIICKGKDVTEEKLDFSGVVNLTVCSEDESKKQEVTIVARNGDPYADKLVYEFMGTYSIPGVAIAVMKDETVQYSAGLGFAVKDVQIKCTADHLFRLASVSKQFTTLCIMKLIEEGKISLDDHVFGEGGILNAQFPGVTGKKATITVRNFLQHNSGFPASPDPMFSSIRDGKTIDGLIRYILDQDLVNEPGSKYAYYNMGFGVLGRIVEVVSGMGYEEYLRNVILAPMGVTDIWVGGDKAHKRANECVYYMQDGTAGYANPMNVIYAAGGIIASANQLMEVLKHIDGKDGVTDTFKKETLELMYNSPSSNYDRYSLGWRIGHSLFPGAHYHSGNLAGTATFWVGGSNGNMSGCVLCNSRSYITNPDFDSAYYILMSNLIAHFK